MQYPHGRCEQCGERRYGHVDGGDVCQNCGDPGCGPDACSRKNRAI